MLLPFSRCKGSLSEDYCLVNGNSFHLFFLKIELSIKKWKMSCKEYVSKKKRCTCYEGGTHLSSQRGKIVLITNIATSLQIFLKESPESFTNAHAICPDKICFVLDKIKFVRDKKFLSETKYFVHGYKVHFFYT